MNPKAITSFKRRFGVDFLRDDIKAEEHCLLACSEGSKMALGMKYLFGWQTEKDPNKSFEIFNQICQENDQENEELKYSLFLLGRCYDFGDGIKKSTIKAIEIYEKAVQMGEYCSMMNLANKFLFGDVSENVKAIIPRAKKLYEIGLEKGFTLSMTGLGLIYQRGSKKDGIEKSYYKALEFFERAINNGTQRNGYTKALIDIGDLYKKGDLNAGIKKNFNKAIEYYEKAIENKEYSVYHDLGLIYEYGNVDSNVEIDLDKSLFYYSKAISHGFDVSKKRIPFLLRTNQNIINWKKDFHSDWKKNQLINSEILYLLLVSKFRKEMSNKLIEDVMVNGIALQIIKFLCHLSPLTLEEKPSNPMIEKNEFQEQAPVLEVIKDSEMESSRKEVNLSKFDSRNEEPKYHKEENKKCLIF